MPQWFGKETIGLATKISQTEIQVSSSTISFGKKIYTSGDTSLDISISGFGGVDQGAVLPETEYKLFIVLDNNELGLVASENRVPANFNDFKMISFFQTDLNSEIINVFQDYQEDINLNQLNTEIVVGETFEAVLPNEKLFQLKTFTTNVQTTVVNTSSTGQGYGVGWSPDKKFVAMGVGLSPFLLIFEVIEDNLIKIPNPVLPPSAVYDVKWSPDGRFLAAAHTTSPFVSIWEKTGNATFTKLANPPVLPTGNAWGVEWSPTGEYLSVTHTTSPFMTVYKRNNITFTKLNNPNLTPESLGYRSKWSLDGKLLYVTSQSFPHLSIYSLENDILTKLPNPGHSPDGICYGLDISPDGKFLVVGQTLSPYVLFYAIEGNSLIRLPNPDVIPLAAGIGVRWSPSGSHVAVAISSPISPLIIYKIENGLFVKINDITVDFPAPISEAYNLDWSPDEEFLSIAYVTNPYTAAFSHLFNLKNVDAFQEIENKKPLILQKK